MINNKFNLSKIIFFFLLFIFYFSLKKKNRPKISLFLPTYNKENFISKCVRSIQNQTLKDIEIIIVNDNSSDNTLTIIDYFSKNDKRIKIVNNDKNYGLLYSRAMGVLNSTGEYLMNIDPDDELEGNDTLEYLYNEALLSKADIINFNILDTGSKKIIKKCTDYHEIWKQPSLFEKIFLSDNIIYDGLVWNKLIKKETFIKAYEFFKDEIFNGKWNYFEDDIWSILVNKFAKSKICLDKLVYIYNLNENSLMHKKLGIMEIQNILYRHEMYKKIFSNKEDEKYLIAEYYFLLNRLKEYINDILLINNTNINEHILNIFHDFLKNYQSSKEQRNDIYNLLKLIN